MSRRPSAVTAALAVAGALLVISIALPAPAAAADGLIVASDTRYRGRTSGLATPT